MLNIYPAGSDVSSPYSIGRENTVWGVSLMADYLWFDGFTSTFQDKLFKGYDMEIHNKIFYTTVCSCILSFTGHLLQAILCSSSSRLLLRHCVAFNCSFN
ncbi:hypothetical protein MLD38_003990 [Melastoma candidum]|uniref:Uncharacterized protein n=1 Tax=Melastoma candidum TaxID=119954 RepID=A0ACB9S857_9MYRT|nr:hypothetical protein MLD38_003990 [Melastoma candidum]